MKISSEVLLMMKEDDNIEIYVVFQTIPEFQVWSTALKTYMDQAHKATKLAKKSGLTTNNENKPSFKQSHPTASVKINLNLDDMMTNTSSVTTMVRLNKFAYVTRSNKI
jgi:hypothetical protein